MTKEAPRALSTHSRAVVHGIDVSIKTRVAHIAAAEVRGRKDAIHTRSLLGRFYLKAPRGARLAEVARRAAPAKVAAAAVLYTIKARRR